MAERKTETQQLVRETIALEEMTSKQGREGVRVVGYDNDDEAVHMSAIIKHVPKHIPPTNYPCSQRLDFLKTTITSFILVIPFPSCPPSSAYRAAASGPILQVDDIDTDDEKEDEKEAYEAWKQRELKRMKRDRWEAVLSLGRQWQGLTSSYRSPCAFERSSGSTILGQSPPLLLYMTHPFSPSFSLRREEKEKLEKEVMEKERLRNMTEEERAAWMAANPKEGAQGGEKAKVRFMQKYWHKGAYFQDEGDDERATAGGYEIFNRDFSAPTGEDRFDKSLMPKVMQVCVWGKG